MSFPKVILVTMVIALMTNQAGATFPGQSFETLDLGLGTNIALHDTPTVDCTDLTPPGPRYPWAATDGTRWHADGRDSYLKSWGSCESDASHWLELDWPTPQTVGTVVIFWGYNGYQEDFQISQEVHFSVWENGDFVEKGVAYPAYNPFPNYSDSVTVFAIDPVQTTKVKIQVPSLLSYPKYLNNVFIAEIEVYSQKAPSSTFPWSAGLEIPDVASAPAQIALSASNPSAGKIAFNCAVPSSGDFHLSVFDAAGKKVWNHSGISTGNSQSIAWNAQHANGVFLTVLRQGHLKIARRILVQ